jgi:hypothetical protein
MNAFSKKTLFVALAAMTVSGAADAVNISDNGLGQVLIYPYYTVRTAPGGAAFNTLLSVVNTTATAKAVKVRFREALNSQEVLDFNLFLSANDVWTAAITPAGGGGAQIATSDLSCTIPAFSGPQPFLTGALSDGGGNTAARTAEGYFEIFEMVDYAAGSAQQKAVTHDQTKTPPKPTCAIDDNSAAVGLPPGGGLMGAVVIVNPTAGGAFTQNATALDNFNNFQTIYRSTQSAGPDYSNAFPFSSTVMSGTGLYTASWATAADAVTSVLMSDAIFNEFALDPTAGPAATNWVITHPTKYLYVNGISPVRPFTSVWNSKTATACETVQVSLFNREETALVTQAFSPASSTSLCWEVNVLGFSNVNLFSSNTFVSAPSTFPNGWASVAFNNGQSLTPTGFFSRTTLVPPLGAAPTGSTYFGLPVIGFSAEAFQQNALTIGNQTVFANFGSEMKHRRSDTTVR